ncbi:hypothetical protein CMI40_00685 [Candidatus Pacearchaeota archaeon]|jgi:hypothetical protein|nr:hypothetical protein [Candidatus Pacearchaeota archaeon]|tara:strand:- start:8126 stop:8416 length:291 start_codon:yes stop_codon:yes gene_type:complete
MAKKKVKRKAKKKSRKVKRIVSKPKRLASNKTKFNLVMKNLSLFVVLFVLSLVLYNVSSNELLSNLFFILALVTGFVSVAFLIIWLVFNVLKYASK